MPVPTSTPHPPQTTARQHDLVENTAAEGACPACPHPLAEHDPIGARFCRATVAGAFRRGCVCRH